jgi:S1-C subfamily serine protease
MNTAADEESACCTYAIPSNTITHIIPVLNITGQYIHPSIGLESRTLTSTFNSRKLWEFTKYFERSPSDPN